eukprot:gnl/TRDRNA2_/TRDRNA2_170928_c1_seq2.p1 gnl/TRDRNA2_/TRDRNA2_170928_c1~~gnl/TRDRNA2_/TRDRNA2_170928_c1_seq2.p1  ORF type:complete len:376 (+),score=51.74 gnl/TRDRNA2_/TRDRNA2_170928_c1_seq2:78-1130(+)
MLAGVYYVLCVRPSASVSLGNGPDGQLIRMGRATEHAKLGVYVRDFDDTGRGLAAATSFASGDVIIQMPLTEAAYIGKHNLYFDLHNVGTLLKGGQGTKQVLALALLFERQKPDTPWASFFSLLPTNVSNIAAMNDLHRRILNRTDLAKKFQDFDEIFQSTARFVKSAGWFFSTLPTDDEVRWALSIVESRAHDRPGGKERIIWPFLVLANHHYEQSRTMTYKTIQGNPTVVQLRSQEPVRAGDQGPHACSCATTSRQAGHAPTLRWHACQTSSCAVGGFPDLKAWTRHKSPLVRACLMRAEIRPAVILALSSRSGLSAMQRHIAILRRLACKCEMLTQKAVSLAWLCRS